MDASTTLAMIMTTEVLVADKDSLSGLDYMEIVSFYIGHAPRLADNVADNLTHAHGLRRGRMP